MAGSPDSLRFVPDPTRETVGILYIVDTRPGVEYQVQPQPFRDRIVTFSPDQIVSIQFGYEDKDYKHKPTGKADLRDLDLEGTRKSEGDLVGLLRESGVNMIESNPRYSEKPKSAVTPEQAMQDVNLTDPWEHLKEFRPKAGVPQVRK